MNPNKKKELVEVVKKAYKAYKDDLLAYYKYILDKNGGNVQTGGSPEEYYGAVEGDIPTMIKPDIRMYLTKEEQKVLKKILNKKPGYEKIRLS